MIGFSALILVVFTASLLASYFQWKKAVADRLNAGSLIAQTARGPIEYAVIGQGLQVLIAHGAMGGHDQGRLIAEAIGSGHLRFIAPSRPGYLRTPLEVGRTAEEQADAFAALLDVLQVPKVAVVGVSGGGPSALQFALRYPTRCSGLVLVSAITQRLVVSRGPKSSAIGPVLGAFLHSDFAGWAAVRIARLRPTWLLKHMISTDELVRLGEGPGSAVLLKLVDSITPLSSRQKGFTNDGTQFGTLVPCALQNIRCPTLIIHGTADRLVPLQASETCAETIPDAQLVRVENGSHFAFLFRDEIGPRIRGFLEQLLKSDLK